MLQNIEVYSQRVRLCIPLTQFIKKGTINRDITQEKRMNCCKQPTEKQLGASASEPGANTKSSLEKVISPLFRIKIKVWATVAASDAMDLKNYKK